MPPTMDAKAWKCRYPALRVVAPAGARAQVEKICKDLLANTVIENYRVEIA